MDKPAAAFLRQMLLVVDFVSLFFLFSFVVGHFSQGSKFSSCLMVFVDSDGLSVLISVIVDCASDIMIKFLVGIIAFKLISRIK